MILVSTIGLLQISNDYSQVFLPGSQYVIPETKTNSGLIYSKSMIITLHEITISAYSG